MTTTLSPKRPGSGYTSSAGSSGWGCFPVASEAYGTHKPQATWAITGVTILISLFFQLAQIGNGGTPPPELRDFMMWTGSRSAQTRQFERLADKYPDQREMIMDTLAKRQASDGEFQWYSLLTNAFLHGGIMHLAGNLLFLFIFGLRVNELIGDLKFAIVYPILAVLASLATLRVAAGPAADGVAGRQRSDHGVGRDVLRVLPGAAGAHGVLEAQYFSRLPAVLQAVLDEGLLDARAVDLPAGHPAHAAGRQLPIAAFTTASPTSRTWAASSAAW